MLAAARVIEMIRGPRRAPVRENAHETPLFDGRNHLILGKEGETESVKCRLSHHAYGIERHTTLNADLQFTPPFMKIPM